MGAEATNFDAAVVAAVGVVLGVAYFLGAMIALLSNGGEGVLLLSDSVIVTTVVGLLLLLAAGFLATGYRSGRYFGLLAFGAVVVFGRPSLATPEPIPVVQTSIALIISLYLVLRNPVQRSERTSVDESTSATRYGSTIR